VTRRRAATLCAIAVACTLPPLRGRIEVGKDSYGVFVGEGSGGTDLHAFHGTTGAVVPLTCSPVAERAPALAPDGSAVLFLREPASVWVMNLLSGAERELVVPRGAGPARAAAWHADSRTVYVRAGGKVWQFALPPGAGARELPSTERGRVDSAFMVLLGDPAFATAAECGVDSLCVVTRNGENTLLAERASAPARWGRDSVAWVRDGMIEVRPLGGGAPRTVELEPRERVIGSISYFAGR